MFLAYPAETKDPYLNIYNNKNIILKKYLEYSSAKIDNFC